MLQVRCVAGFRPGLLLVLSVVVTGCVSTEELYARYDCDVCPPSEAAALPVPAAAPVAASQAMLWEPAVYFDFDRAQLSAAEQQRLETDLAFLRRYPETRVAIRGYTDSFGSRGYNEALADRRVAAVADYLLEQGLSSNRLARLPVGESAFLRPGNESGEARAINRRVELIPVNADNVPFRLSVERPQAVEQRPGPGQEGQRRLRRIDEVVR